MHVILLALGLLAGVAGVALIGTDLPLSPATLGNTLVIAGTVAIVGSLILIGLASAVRQLRRIAQALEARPLARAAGAEAAEPAPRVEVPVRAPAFEPRLDAAAELSAPPAEPPVQPVAEAPQAVPPPAAPAAEAPVPVAAAPPVLPPSPPSPPPPLAPEKVFEAVWSGEPAGRPREGVVAAATSATVVEVSAVEERAAEPSAPGAEPVRIFKSGVIDGMAYTLYTDGSIEAELAQGTVKFASIDELRAYLAAREE
jgi:hypothetical protein